MQKKLTETLDATVDEQAGTSSSSVLSNNRVHLGGTSDGGCAVSLI